MAAATDVLRVEGLRELQRALKVADADLQRDFRETLRRVAEPVRVDAEQLALLGIPRIGLPWSRMRVGVTQTLVYVAPKRRGRGQHRRRPNLFGLLMSRSLEPALARNREFIRREATDVIVDVARKWNRG